MLIKALLATLVSVFLGSQATASVEMCQNLDSYSFKFQTQAKSGDLLVRQIGENSQGVQLTFVYGKDGEKRISYGCPISEERIAFAIERIAKLAKIDQGTEVAPTYPLFRNSKRFAELFLYVVNIGSNGGLDFPQLNEFGSVKRVILENSEPVEETYSVTVSATRLFEKINKNEASAAQIVMFSLLSNYSKPDLLVKFTKAKY